MYPTLVDCCFYNGKFRFCIGHMTGQKAKKRKGSTKLNV